MATSGSIDYSTSKNDIITEALQLVGVLGEGQSPSSDQLADCSRTLNMMTKAWQAEGFNLFTLATQTVDLVASTATYTLSPRPMQILNAVIRNTSGNDIPLEQITRREYVELNDKDAEGAPTLFYYDPQVGTGNTFTVWPVPSDTEYDVVIWYHRTLEDFDGGDDEPDFPQEWYMALTYGLAVHLTDKYGTPVMLADRLRIKADELKEAAWGFDAEHTIYFQPDWRGN